MISHQEAPPQGTLTKILPDNPRGPQAKIAHHPNPNQGQNPQKAGEADDGVKVSRKLKDIARSHHSE